jgi:hypothetical protein
MRIWVKIDHPYFHVSQEATELGGTLDENGKTKAPCHSRCAKIKIPPCSKALNAENRPIFISLLSAIMTSPYQSAAGPAIL